MNYGDEGKGRVVSVLASGRVAVIKYNGGSQAGHRVVAPDGASIVNHQLGSGSFLNPIAITHIPSTFFFDPIKWREEVAEFKAKTGRTPITVVNPHAKVVTPLDVMENQLTERERGEARHGSCGHGIFRAYTRVNAGNILCVEHLNREDKIRHCLSVSLNDCPNLTREMDAMGIKRVDLIDRCVHEMRMGEEECGAFGVMGRPPVSDRDRLVFEGGQGLLLGMNMREWMPHLTPSNTNCEVPALLSVASDGGSLNAVVYVTRPYVTRHGAGPLEECPETEFSAMAPRYSDPSNEPNPWQGAIRRGLWTEGHVARVKKALERDTRAPKKRVIALTCADQCSWYRFKGRTHFTRLGFMQALSREFDMPVLDFSMDVPDSNWWEAVRVAGR